MHFSELKANSLLRILLNASSILIIVIYFVYRTNTWPLGMEATGCLVSFILLSVTGIMLWKLRDRFTDGKQEQNVAIGFYLGLLWLVEISMNNFLHPVLPYRDRLDNMFWLTIALLILAKASRDAYQSGKFLPGLRSGLWLGLSSGAVACLSALILIVFGMRYILSDPLNVKEWADTRSTADTTSMAVYFAYQSFAGAIMHLYILGILMGLLLGSVGGVIGFLLKKIQIRT